MDVITRARGIVAGIAETYGVHRDSAPSFLAEFTDEAVSLAIAARRWTLALEGCAACAAYWDAVRMCLVQMRTGAL